MAGLSQLGGRSHALVAGRLAEISLDEVEWCARAAPAKLIFLKSALQLHKLINMDETSRAAKAKASTATTEGEQIEIAKEVIGSLGGVQDAGPAAGDW